MPFSRAISIILSALLFLQLIPAAVAAQPIPHFVEKLTTEQGLSSNFITDITQDNQGFLWISTSDGLNRFDGTEVTQFYHHNNSNSLPHNYIYCLQKLPGNYLAIGTEGGLSFYQGSTGAFHNFYYQSDSGLDQHNNAIIALRTDATGNLWALARSCIFIFDSLHRLKKLIPSGFKPDRSARERISFADMVWPFSDGDVLIHQYNGWHLYSKHTGTISDAAHSPRLRLLPFLHDIDTLDTYGRSIPGFASSRLFKVFDSYFLTVRGNDLTLYDEYGHKCSSCPFPYNKYPFILWAQRFVPVDSARMLYLFHNYGLATLSLSWRDHRPVLDSLSSLMLAENQYSAAQHDLQDNWWLATARDGLRKIVPSRQCFMDNTLVDARLHQPVRHETISFSRSARQLWIATYGEGFFGIDERTNRQQQYRFKNTGNDTWANFVWNIRQVTTDTLWVGTQAGLFWYCLSSRSCGRLPPYPGKPTVLDQVAITTQFRDSHGLIWLGLGKGNGLCCFDPTTRRFTWYRGGSADGYPLRYPLFMAETKTGDLWLTNDATSSLVHWQRSSGHFNIVPLPGAVQRHIGPLNGITIENDSILWLASVTCGLIKFDPATQSLSIYGHERGLANSRTGGIFEDSTNRIWLTTEGGLACFNPQSGIFVNYTTNNGLPVTGLTADFLYDTVTHRVYAGGYGRYFYFDPRQISSDNRPPRTLITSILVNNKPRLLAKDPIRLSARENDITIRFAAVDLTDGPAIRYAYRLSGDTGWMPADKQRQINFSNLGPGDYTFLVRAAAGNGLWSREPAAFSFRIAPPFKQTGWFYALLFLVGGSAAWLLYSYRLSQLQRSRQMRSEISRNLHDEVGANLTNISLSSLLAQKQLHNEVAVSQLLERIYQDSQQVSESMREIVWSINPDIDTLGEALPRMIHYASTLLEARGIELEAAVSPQVEHLRLGMQQRRDIYLIFKEAVNNMAKHSKATQAHIRFHLTGRTLTMTVHDNGSGFDNRTTLLQNGLKNMRERARLHQWQLEISSGPHRGTTITLDIPGTQT